jgi:uncharacterized protein YndB with AHSA1/START domain
MPTRANATAAGDAVVTEVFIAAPPEQVLQALTRQEQLMQWFTDPSCPLKSFEMDAREGGRWRFATHPGSKPLNGVFEFRAAGKILELKPRALVYTWHANWHDDPSLATLVRWELIPEAKGTRVRITHSGLASEELARKDYLSGWPGVLAMLKNFTETK